MTPLCFASPSPPSDWTGDFHSPAIEHAGHTTKSLPRYPLRGRVVLDVEEAISPLGRLTSPHFDVATILHAPPAYDPHHHARLASLHLQRFKSYAAAL